MPPMSMVPNGPSPPSIGMLFGGTAIPISAMLAHAVLAHRHVARQQLAEPCGSTCGLHADHVRGAVAHLVHHVMGHVAVHRPVAGLVGDELDRARAADGHEHRRLGVLRRLRERRRRRSR